LNRHQHRGQRKLFDQAYGRRHHHGGGLTGLELLQATRQLDLLVVDAGLIQAVGHIPGKLNQQGFDFRAESPAVVAVVDTEHTDGLAQADNRHDVAVAHADLAGKLAVGRALLDGGVSEINGILAGKNAGYDGFDGDDRKAVLADIPGHISGNVDAGKYPPGQILQIDAHPLATGKHPGTFPQGIQQLTLILFSIGGNLAAQGRQTWIAGHKKTPVLNYYTGV